MIGDWIGSKTLSGSRGRTRDDVGGEATVAVVGDGGRGEIEDGSATCISGIELIQRTSDDGRCSVLNGHNGSANGFVSSDIRGGDGDVGRSSGKRPWSDLEKRTCIAVVLNAGDGSRQKV